MVKTGLSGLGLVEEIYLDRRGFAQNLKRQEKSTVLGYFCLYPPLEIMTALGLFPFRLLGDAGETVTRADACLPTVVCPFVRSTLDLGLKGKYDFLDGVVMCHSCEVGEKTAHIWKTYLKPQFFHFIDVPHTVHQSARAQFKAQLKSFGIALEEFTGKKLTDDDLRKAIDLHNRQRDKVRTLYGLRKSDPPPVSGAEILKIMVALMSLPVRAGNELLQQVQDELANRPNLIKKHPARLLIWGSLIDNTPLIEIIEELDAVVVMDDMCVGSRAYFSDVPLTDDPWEGLAHHYLDEIKCPRTFREASYGETKKDYETDLNSRFGYIRDYARDWRANGVILQSLRYCDTHGYEVPLLRDFLNQNGLPNIYIEHDYSQAGIASLRTRLQAFIEMIT